MNAPNLIRCGDHKMAPWSVVCIHLMNGTSRKWIPLESDNPEVDFDWLCPACSKKLDIKNIRPICIHCVRHLRQKFDSNFKDDDDA